ncbi:hypothetical protein Hanom_Chr10g00882971 [Helianthus anomalus]
MVLTASIKVLFFLSTTPFCYGVLGMLYCLTIPFFTQKASNSLFFNSVPLSLLKLFTGRSNCFSTCVTRSCKMHAVSSFECKKESPCKPRKVINYNQTISFLFEAHDLNWAKQIHVQHLQTLGCFGLLNGLVRTFMLFSF